MPELAEIQLMSDCINTLKGKRVKPHLSRFKNLKLNKLPKSCYIVSESRGKELKVILENSSKVINMFFNMGMTGHITIQNKIQKNTRLSFQISKNKFLNLNDMRWFARVAFREKWSEKRSPCPVKEYDLFVENLTTRLQDKFFKTHSIGESMLQQKYFNGIGNYLRAEILYRANIKPWENAYKVLKDKKKFNKIVKLCNKLPLEVLKLNLDITNWTDENAPNKFEKWQKVYHKGKSYQEKSTKRTMWYNPKLRKPKLNIER